MAMMRVSPRKPMPILPPIIKAPRHQVNPDRGRFLVTKPELTPSDVIDKKGLNELRVNQDRLMNDIHHSCQWGQGERWGK